jgi:phosphotransferase system IIA component
MIRKVCCPVMQQADIAFPNSHAANTKKKRRLDLLIHYGMLSCAGV